MKPQTPPTEQGYAEPKGFKGTIGEWAQGTNTASKEWMQIFSGKKIVAQVNSINRTGLRQAGDFEKEDANAKLISQSKELAKALQEIIENAAPVPDYPGEFFLHKLSLENAKQVLKDAGLTDK